MFDHEVFEREANLETEISPRLYNFIIGLTLLWGFLVNWQLVVNIDPQVLLAINPWIFIGGYFASCLLGIYLFNSFDNPWISFIGYNLVVVPFGLIVNMVVSQFDEAVVLDAIRLTTAVTVIMMILGTLYPAFFRRIVAPLTLALILVLIMEFYMIIFMQRFPHWSSWIVIIIFCGYIGFDWGRANQIPKTVDNAIDSAAALYMDIINLFLRILSAMGRKN